MIEDANAARQATMKTPTTPEGLRQYDHLHWVEAIRSAWAVPGDNPEWHFKMKSKVCKHMPLLARALNRLEATPHQLIEDQKPRSTSAPIWTAGPGEPHPNSVAYRQMKIAEAYEKGVQDGKNGTRTSGFGAPTPREKFENALRDSGWQGRVMTGDGVRPLQDAHVITPVMVRLPSGRLIYLPEPSTDIARGVTLYADSCGTTRNRQGDKYILSDSNVEAIQEEIGRDNNE